MVIFQYIYYFFRSLYYRGFRNTYKLLKHEATDEKKLNINTNRIINIQQLSLAGKFSREHHPYQGASYYILYLLFNKLPKALKETTFVDYGCGKGRALFVAEQCGFTKLIGVDIAQELIDGAQENLEVYKRKQPYSQFELVFSDATTYHIPKEACVFYFFNPFGESILIQVLQKIKASVKQYPRGIVCLYLNPKYKQAFEKNGFTILFEEKNKRYTEAIVYKL